MANKGPQGRLGATDSSQRPGCFALGSPESRAAARAMLVARKASEEHELRFQAVSILDGSPVNLDGLAEIIRAARMRIRAGNPHLRSSQSSAVGKAMVSMSASRRRGHGWG